MDKAKLCAHMARHFKARSAAGLGRPLHRADAAEFLNELQRLCVRELRAGRRVSLSGIAVVGGAAPAPACRPRSPHRRAHGDPGATRRARTDLGFGSAARSRNHSDARGRWTAFGPEEDNAGTGTR